MAFDSFAHGGETFSGDNIDPDRDPDLHVGWAAHEEFGR
jgi:hypothetical protein